MDFRTLRYFVTVAEERHAGRAASRLFMSQPPLSRAIRQLEEELGVILLERTPKGVALTQAGTALYEEAGALLGHADRIRDRVTAAVGTATLAVGTLTEAVPLSQARSGPLAGRRPWASHGSRVSVAASRCVLPDRADA